MLHSAFLPCVVGWGSSLFVCSGLFAKVDSNRMPVASRVLAQANHQVRRRKKQSGQENVTAKQENRILLI